MSKNFWLITKIVFVIVAPFEVFRALSVGDVTNDWQLTIGMFALEIMCNVLIAPALIYALMKVMQTGVAPGVNESYRWGLTKIGKLALCAAMSWALSLLGILLFVIPGIILGLAFQLVYPMAVLEKLSPVEVLKGSYELTKGHRLKILGAGITIALLLGVITVPASGVAALLALYGLTFWPLNAVIGIFVAIIGQCTTVLALVTYLSILRTLESRQSVIE